MATHNELLVDEVRAADSSAAPARRSATATDTVTSSEGLAYLYGAILNERIRLTETLRPNATYRLAQVEAIRIYEALIKSLPLSASDAITAGDSLTLMAGVAIMERLRVRDIILPTATYQHTTVERLRLADSVARFFGLDATDEMTLSDVLGTEFFKGAAAGETIEVGEELDRLFMLRVVGRDDLVIDDSNLPQMIFDAGVVDGLEILAGIQLPGAGFTTWAMNTRTGAVTEYRDYAFNSFARMGNRYLGASDDGLFELTGDSDDGEDVIATIRSGFAQWTGAHLHAFKAAYLAVRGEGDYVLRLITGDGKVFNYQVSQDSMRTTKVNMGKGLRARYFAFELVSTGQDFDLESLEFIPLAAQRRV